MSFKSNGFCANKASLHVISTALWLTAGPAMAQQFFGEHYIQGSAGIKAGTLPPPGICFDDVNLYLQVHSQAGGGGADLKEKVYVNEPRLKWISQKTFLGANYGAELMVPFSYEDTRSKSGPDSYTLGQFEVDDLEISPLMLGWHWQRFDLTAGYAFWVPTGANSYTWVSPHFGVVPFQGHWWANMFTLGGTWYPDADKQWAVSSLSHFEINEPYNIGGGSESFTYGQMFTTEWGVSRKTGKYFELGLAGNYSQQVSASKAGSIEIGEAHPTIEVGPEIGATVPQWDFSVSLRYLRQLNNPNNGYGNYNLNVFALTLSKRF